MSGLNITENPFLLNEEGFNTQGLKVICPTCKFEKKIHIPRNILKLNGLTTLSIPKNTICPHHFQIFIDTNMKIRGYQKVDLELSKEVDEVRFKCQLCNAIIKFRPNDEASYLIMEPYQKFLGSELRSYKVAHYTDDELHINTAIIDKNGDLTSILESHSVKLEQYNNNENFDLKYFNYEEEHKQVKETHPIFGFFVIFNTYDHWKYDLICSPMFNSIDLTAIAQKKMEEAMSIYSKTPEYMNISIADKEFHLWVSESNVMCINLKDESNIQWLRPLITEFIEKAIYEGNLISNSSRLLIINEVFNGVSITKEKLPLIRRLIFDNLLYSKINIKYPNRIENILIKIILRFNLERSFILGFFYQEKSIIEFLKEQDKFDYFEEFLEIIDFINRRNLLE